MSAIAENGRNVAYRLILSLIFERSRRNTDWNADGWGSERANSAASTSKVCDAISTSLSPARMGRITISTVPDSPENVTSRSEMEDWRSPAPSGPNARRADRMMFVADAFVSLL
ncbi:MAG TPA: hypothetical protein VMM78_04530 [Thermomicrobiales bacterium]|nr:hypothetical protein [Thermomicrobiales bacterium]